MPIYLYNTITRRKEVFTPLKKGRVSFYACGPTVYDYSHVGNFRTYLFEDILRRALEYNGYKVKHVMNFTDVGHLVSDADTGEDKMEKGSKRENKTAWQIADFYIIAFKRDAAILNIEIPTIYARATKHIKEQIALVKILEQKGFTYIIDDGVYFDTSKLPDYGALAKLDIEGLKAGARIEQTAGKKNITDFALWKFTPNRTKKQMEWDSPWSPPGSKIKVPGFPGWHLECSAMSQKYLGRQFDIHAGAIDLIPVHHTNEIAQSEAAYGQNPARYWLHGEFVLIEGEKMAKSLGNFITIAKLSAKFNPLAFRYLILTAHYRSQLNLTWESLEAAQSALNNLYRQTRDLRRLSNPFWPLIKFARALGLYSKKTSAIMKLAAEYKEKFREAVNDDLNTPEALALVWQMLNDQNLPAAAKINLLLKFDGIFGLYLAKIKSACPPSHIKKLAQEREIFRKNQNWVKADELRAQIDKEGWLVEDTPQGPKLIEKNIHAN